MFLVQSDAGQNVQQHSYVKTSSRQHICALEPWIHRVE